MKTSRIKAIMYFQTMKGRAIGAPFYGFFVKRQGRRYLKSKFLKGVALVMRIFDTDVQELKYKVLKEVVKLERIGALEQEYHSIPKTIIPGPRATMRCCIYHERAIVEERVKLAMGGDKLNPNIVEVIDCACDECPVKRFFVTDACRGCLSHRCQSVCPVGAITTDKHKSVIDTEKCIECGRCMKACPYSAIIENQRPCVKGCVAKAITINEQKKASIDSKKCTGCGACVYQCPFGAIVDKSYIIDVLRLIKSSANGKNYKVYAVVAPSFAGQFSYAKPGQIVSGIKRAGFNVIVEAALGADVVAKKEAEELVKKGFLTSSCCPAFVSYVKENFPDISGHISSNISPMAETAKLIKKADTSAKVVFIGPCTAKKLEIKQPEIAGLVDSVLTFEELQSLFDGMGILIEALPEETIDDASCYGRIFARSGGLSEAIKSVIENEALNFNLSSETCNGAEQCKVALLKASKGKLDKNFIEGMFCEDGCIGGAACLTHSVKNVAVINKYSALSRKKSVDISLNELSTRKF
jgi:[FeFe] hydrogenase (group B1/B3)